MKELEGGDVTPLLSPCADRGLGSALAVPGAPRTHLLRLPTSDDAAEGTAAALPSAAELAAQLLRGASDDLWLM